MKNKKIKTIIFPVAGLGTRFLPATKSIPKEMLPVAQKPLIHYVFEEALDAGIEKFIFVTGRNKDVIENYFDINYELDVKLKLKNKNDLLKKTNAWLPKPGQIIFLRQQETLGLGHAILCAEKIIPNNEPFAVSLPDELFLKKKTNPLKEMINIYENNNKPINIIAVKEVEKKKDVSKYGIIGIKEDLKEYFNIKKIIEKPKPEDTPSTWGVTGRYVFDYKIFEYLKNIKPGYGNEIQITDAIQQSLKDYETYAYKILEERFDCGNIIGFLKANLTYSLLDSDIKNDIINIVKDLYKKI